MASTGGQSGADGGAGKQVRDPTAVVSAYRSEGTPTAVISTSDENGLGPETVDDLLDAVISTAADHPETSKRRIAYHLIDHAQHLEIEANRDDV